MVDWVVCESANECECVRRDNRDAESLLCKVSRYRSVVGVGVRIKMVGSRRQKRCANNFRLARKVGVRRTIESADNRKAS